MGIIKPNPKNIRTCEKCNATYCINGDESEYWCEMPLIEEVDGKMKVVKIEGKCEFCKDTGKYSLKNY